MKASLSISLAFAALNLSFARADETEPAPGISYARSKYEAERTKLLKKLNIDYINHLTRLQAEHTKKSDLDTALQFRREIQRIESADASLDLLKKMSGKWVFNTGNTTDFDRNGRNLNGDLVIWVIDPAKRLLYFRGSQKWYYDIVLSEDGTTFTATRIQSGKKVKR